MQSKAKTVEEYLAELPDDRREQISTIRDEINKNLPEGYEETMNWGMISYEIPLARYPETYNKQPLMLAALASQKNHMAVYLNAVYADAVTYEWFIKEYKKTGKKLDMGKSCVRFRNIENLPVELIGKVISMVSVDDYIKTYEQARKK